MTVNGWIFEDELGNKGLASEEETKQSSAL